VGSPISLPTRDRQWGSEDARASLIAILADLPDFATLGFIQRRHGPVVDDQDVDATQSREEVAQTSIRSGQG
jgi:hypothetical protein